MKKWLFNWYIFPTCYLTLRHLRNWKAMRTHLLTSGQTDQCWKVSIVKAFFKQKPNQSWGTTRLLNEHSVVTPLQDIFPTRLHSFVTFVNKVDTYLLLVNNTRLPTSFQQVSQSRVEFYSTNKLFNYNLQTQTRFLSPDLNMWLKSIIQDQCVMPMHT